MGKTKVPVWCWIVMALMLVLILILLSKVEGYSYEDDERILDSNPENQKPIERHIKMLEDDSYEVLYFGYLGEDTPSESAYLKMKSLGSKNEQVWNGLFSLNRVYPEAQEYTIRILEPTQECYYFIEGKLYRGYLGQEEYTLNGKNVTNLEFYNAINYLIENVTCS